MFPSHHSTVAKSEKPLVSFPDFPVLKKVSLGTRLDRDYRSNTPVFTNKEGHEPGNVLLPSY